MGGQEDGQGSIEPDELIQIIKDEFAISQEFVKQDEESESLYKIPEYYLFFTNVA